MMLRLEVGEISVDDLWGAEHVDPEDLAAAEPDPMVAHETELLQHLHSAHGDRLGELCGLLGAREARGMSAVPLSLDRLGLRVRFTGGAVGSFDARFDFPEPVADICGLRRAMHSCSRRPRTSRTRERGHGAQVASISRRASFSGAVTESPCLALMPV